MRLLSVVNPVNVTKIAFGLVGTAVGTVDTAVRGTARVVVSVLHELGRPEQGAAGPLADSAAPADLTSPVQGLEVVAPPLDEVEGAPKGPPIVAVEPHAPEEPPIDVVGETLAAEAALENRGGSVAAGVAHEPRAASRDEEHGDGPSNLVESDGIDEEVAAALEGDDQSPQGLTQPLLDPADAQMLTAEMDT
jgi:hypothetical protein